MRECSGWGLPLRGFAPAVILTAGLATAIGTPDSAAAETNRRCCIGTGHDPAIDVGALLVVDSSIPMTAMRTMQAEVERIWNRYGVRIRWLGHGRHAPDSRANVDVLVDVDPSESGYMRPTGRNILGCFRSVRDGDSRPVITIFPQHAQRLAGDVGAHLCGHRCLEAWLERLQGRLLGRALAHEMGHYLLGSEHTSDGLMRAEFHPRDVLAEKLEAVSLTDSQVQRLSSRALQRAGTRSVNAITW
jgi:hypothetical protein